MRVLADGYPSPADGYGGAVHVAIGGSESTSDTSVSLAYCNMSNNGVGIGNGELICA